MENSTLAALTTFNIFLDGLSKNYSDPANMSEQDVWMYMENLRQTPQMRGEFYMVGSVMTVDVRHQAYSQNFLPLGSIFNADEYISLIHPDYIVGYLKWATACYAFADEIAQTYNIIQLGVYFRLTFPLLFNDGNYYWTLLEASPLQVDKNNNMISHLNRYIRLNLYSIKPKYLLRAEILGSNHFNAPQWMQALYAQMERRADAFSRLTPAEKKILSVLHDNPNFTIKDIAQRFGKDEETIKGQRKSILAKARENFPRLEVKDLKELILFLEPYGYLTNLAFYS